MADRQRAPSRRELKEITRQRLIDGAIELLRREGVHAATTRRVADAAGIKQSSFYGHFKDRDECLEAAAAKIGGFVLERVRRKRSSIDPGNLRATIHGAFASIIRAFLAEPELTRIFLRYRADDDSPLGRAFRGMVERARSSLQRDLQVFGVARSSAQAQAYSEMLVSGTLGLIEGLLDGRVDDREAALDAMTHVTSAAFAASLDRKD